MNLREIIPPSALRQVEPPFFKGKTLAVDAFNAIYQFLTTIRQADGTPLMDSSGLVTSHISGLFYRNCKLLEEGARIAYVFDGEPPKEKAQTLEKREETKREAERKYSQAIESGDSEAARKFSHRISRLTPEMVAESKALLEALGVSVVQAPGEGEAQAAFLANSGKVDFCASQDYDSLLFGAPFLVRNLGASGKRRVPGRSFLAQVPIEIIDSVTSLSELGLTREKLIALAILIGTDYNPGGVRGIGPKKGLAIVQKSESFESVFEKISLGEGTDSPENLRKLFLNPRINEKVELNFGKFDKGRIVEIMCEKHGFSRERIDGTIEKVEEAQKEASRQKGLDNWF